jgi:4-diphosphocytidyl-2-C-methyl-D-erythritol kinase
VPFCLTGGAAWMRGRGELLEPVDLAAGLAFVIAVPPFRLATPAVYDAWDELGGPRARRSVPAPEAVAGIVGAELTNDLEPAAEAVEHGLADFRAAVENVAGGPALLAGSGGAYAVPCEDDAAAADLAQQLSRRLHVPAAAGTTMARGVRVA